MVEARDIVEIPGCDLVCFCVDAVQPFAVVFDKEKGVEEAIRAVLDGLVHEGRAPCHREAFEECERTGSANLVRFRH